MMNEGPFPRKVVSFSPLTHLMRKILYYASFIIQGTKAWRAELPTEGHS